ncbi:MAG: methyltransferase domain-containing protein [Gemmatimonadota bacterium]
MDAPDCDIAYLGEALDVLARANRLLGGWETLWRQLGPLVAGRTPGPLRLLDVGVGGGDLSRRLHARLVRLGWGPRFVLADLHERSLGLARERWRGGAAGLDGRHGRFVRLTASRLPFADRSFDVAYSTTTLHHLERNEAIGLLAELGRVARLGWVITDLRRSRLALAAVSLLGATLWRTKRFSRRDGPASVRRSFTPAEIDALVAEAGLRATRLRAGPFRLSVRGERP